MDYLVLPTEYNNRHFSSRTEARWARFLDEIDVRYDYEIEAFLFNSGTKYFPDFFVYDLDAWIEVKGLDTLKDFGKWKIAFRKGIELCKGTQKPVLIIYGLPGGGGYSTIEFIHPIISHITNEDINRGVYGCWYGFGCFAKVDVYEADGYSHCFDTGQILKWNPPDWPLSKDIGLRLFFKHNDGWLILTYLFAKNHLQIRRWSYNDPDREWAWPDSGFMVNLNPSPFNYQTPALYGKRLAIGKEYKFTNATQKMLSMKFIGGKMQDSNGYR